MSLDTTFKKQLEEGRSRVRELRKEREKVLQDWIADRIAVNSFNVASKLLSVIDSLGGEARSLFDEGVLDRDNLSDEDVVAVEKLEGDLSSNSEQIAQEYKQLRNRVYEKRVKRMEEVFLDNYDLLIGNAWNMIKQFGVTRVDAGDLVQMMYVKIFTKYSDPKGPRPVKNVEPFLYVVLKNTVIDELRKQNVENKEYRIFFELLRGIYVGTNSEEHVERQIGAQKDEAMSQLVVYLRNNMSEFPDAIAAMRQGVYLFYSKPVADELNKMDDYNFGAFLNHVVFGFPHKSENLYKASRRSVVRVRKGMNSEKYGAVDKIEAGATGQGYRIHGSTDIGNTVSKANANVGGKPTKKDPYIRDGYQIYGPRQILGGEEVREYTLEDFRKAIIQKVPSYDRWKEMSWRERQDFDVEGVKLYAISTRFNVQGNPFTAAVFKQLGEVIFANESKD